jgi:hypothetical protein
MSDRKNSHGLWPFEPKYCIMIVHVFKWTICLKNLWRDTYSNISEWQDLNPYVWVHKASLTLSLVIEVPVPSYESEQSCM